jgi:Fuc2NAc and GlcNAc transferase
MQSLLLYWPPILTFVLSCLSVGATYAYALKRELLAVPNPRSSHQHPTPVGGGLGLTAAVAGVAAWAIGGRGHESLTLWGFLAASLVMLTIVGWLDDERPLSVGVRLVSHVMCGVGVAIVVNRIIPMPGALNYLNLAWWIFWTVASINIVNFMDGIDGMIGSQGVVFGLYLFALLPENGAGAPFGLVLAAGCLGFLVWNWPPAKIFMGDSGSGSLGLFFVIGGALALYGANAVVGFLPLFLLYFDAFATLARRARAGERLTSAHRTHVYQRLANGGLTHSTVSLIYALMAAIGALVGIAINGSRPRQMGLGIAAYCGGAVLVWKLLDVYAARRSETTHPVAGLESRNLEVH